MLPDSPTPELQEQVGTANIYARKANRNLETIPIKDE